MYILFIIIIEHIGRYVANLVAPSNNKKEHLNESIDNTEMATH